MFEKAEKHIAGSHVSLWRSVLAEYNFVDRLGRCVCHIVGIKSHTSWDLDAANFIDESNSRRRPFHPGIGEKGS